MNPERPSGPGRPLDDWRLRACTVIFEADTREGRAAYCSHCGAKLPA